MASNFAHVRAQWRARTLAGQRSAAHATEFCHWLVRLSFPVAEEPEAVLLPNSGGTTHRIRPIPLNPLAPGCLPRASRHLGGRTTPDVGTHLVGLYSKLRGF